MPVSILVIENDESLLISFGHFLTEAGFTSFSAKNYDDAITILTSHPIDAVIADIVLEGKSGIDILRTARENKIDCPFIIMTGYPEVETASEAVRLDAFDYLVKPVEKEALLRIARTSTEHFRLKKENERYKNNLDAIFRYVQEGICFVDQQLTIIEANQSFRRICGFPERCVGSKNIQTKSQCSGQCFAVLRETIETKKPLRVDRIECDRSARKGQVVTISTSPLFDNRRSITGAIAVIRDETYIVALEKKNSNDDHFYDMIGSSEKMKEVYSVIKMLSSVKSPTTVLITGESGTGKDLVAEAIHKSSSRANEKFEKVDCPSLSNNLLESELFGHVRGAFTGAVTDHVGKFEYADKGTIFLNEVTELSLENQTKLLRFLNDKIIQRIGQNEPIEVDVRIIAATNRDLPQAVRQKEFREDLYYRLNVIIIKVPPLRERQDDIALLSTHFLKKYSTDFNKKIESLSADVLDFFKHYSWPGNVRQLKHCIEHACLLCKSTTITVNDLPLDIRQDITTKVTKPIDCFVTAEEAEDMVKSCDGNKTEAARRLNISRQTLYRKLPGKDQDAIVP
jgi:two-component system, NtrC family, response regulator HydG